jgi:hypothetical protein
MSADSVPSSKTNIFQSKLIYCRHFEKDGTWSELTWFETTVLIGNDEKCIRMAVIFKMAADKIGKISMFSDFNENWYLGLFWSEELIGNDENSSKYS